MLSVAPAPGQPARNVAVLEVVRAGERAIDAEDFAGAMRIGAQLRNLAAVASEGVRLMLLVALALGRPRDAWERARELMAMGIPDSRTALPVAQGLHFCSCHQQALQVIDAALRDEPAHAQLRALRGTVLANLGDRAGAEQEVRRALRIGSRDYSPYRLLAMLGRITPEDMTDLESADIPPSGRVDACMALASGYRRQGDRMREFEYLQRAHAIQQASDPWSPEEEQAMVQAIETVYTPELIARLPELPPGAQRPIFIVGMPRSGSTMTEQILVSTGLAGGAGESQVFPWLLADLSEQRYGAMDYPQLATVLTRDDLLQLQTNYLDTMHEVFTQAAVVVDKQFANYKYVGLLARIFPDARFLHTVRDPLDIILSNYQHAFAMAFTHDLGHLAQEIRNRSRIMAHWHRLLPGRILDVCYEDMVREPEPRMRALLEFCGLPWSEQVLKFNEVERPVKTASLVQVRQPIYQSSVQRWKPYASLLEPARRVLAEG
jgi:tetratricopeptide (TPR) repeat protein